MEENPVSMTPPNSQLFEQNDSEEEPMNVNIDNQLDYMDVINGIGNELNYPDYENPLFIKHSPSCNKDEEKKFLFECQGEIHPMNAIGKNSYLGSLALDNLLQKGNPFGDSTADLKIIYPSDMLYERLSHCFMMARKAIQLLEKRSKPFFTREVDSVCNTKLPLELRREVIDVLQGLSALVPVLDIEDDVTFLRTVVYEVVELIKFLGPLHLVPSHVTNASSPQGNKNLSSSFHLLHLHLDVRWWSLCLLQQVERKCNTEFQLSSWVDVNFDNEMKMQPEPEESEDRHKIFNWLSRIIVWDLLTLMKRQSSKGTISEVFGLPPFPCICSYELAISLLHLTEWRHVNYNQISFWSLINKRLLLLLMLKKDDKISKEQQIVVSGFAFPPSTFHDLKVHQIWWMFTKIATFFQYDSRGFLYTSNSVLIKSELKMLRTLIKATLFQCHTNSNFSEEELRFYVRCCLSVQELWQHDTESKHSDWVISLWEYFSKILNSTFMIKGNTLDGFATLNKTPSTFIKQIQILTENYDVEKSESSWLTFLRIVVHVVNSNENEWRILKGRINSRFHSKKMAELSPVGIYNTSLLFLALANVKDLTLCTKLCDLLADVPQGCINKIDAVLHSLTATAYLLVSRNCHLKCIAEKFEEIISSVCHQCTSSMDPIQRPNVGRSIIMLCNGFQEVLETSSDLTLGQGILFSSSLSSFCSHATIIEQGSILSCLNVTLSKVLKAKKELHTLADGTGLDILEPIWCNFQGYIKSQLQSSTIPANLGSICSLLVMCAARCYFSSKSLKIAEATTLISYILDKDLVSGRIALQFLSCILKENDSILYISKVCENYDEKMVECLLTSLIKYGSSDEVIVGAEAIFGIPKLKDLMDNPPACPFGAFEMLIQNLSKKFKSSESSQDRTKQQNRAIAYIMPLEKYLVYILKKIPLPSHLPLVLNLVGCIFSYAMPLFYIKSKPYLPVPKLISAVILPSTIYSLEKPLGSVMSDALIPVLPKVIVGLSSLGPSSNGYVSRCLGDIFHNYANRFPFTSHPFLQVLSDENIPNSKELKLLFIETLNSNFISKKNNCNQAHLQLVLSLLQEFLNVYKEHWLHILREFIFAQLLELLLHLEDLHTKRITTNFLQKLLLQAENYSLSANMVERITEFTVCNISHYQGNIFRILEVMSVMNPNIMIKCLPGIAKAIKIAEEKRGTGSDQALRKGFYSLTDKLKVKDDILNM